MLQNFSRTIHTMDHAEWKTSQFKNEGLRQQVNIVPPQSMPATLDETKIYFFGFHVDGVATSVIVLPCNNDNESNGNCSPAPHAVAAVEEAFNEAVVRV